jgi:hypothetical protein
LFTIPFLGRSLSASLAAYDHYGGSVTGFSRNHIQLCSMGFQMRLPVTTFYPMRFTSLRVSRSSVG